MPTFGYDAGDVTANVSNGSLRAARLLAPEGAYTLTGIQILSGASQGYGVAHFAIYEDVGGVPGALLLYAGQASMAGVNNGSWCTLSGLAFPLVPGRHYHFMVLMSVDNYMMFNSTAPSSYRYLGWGVTTFPNPFGAASISPNSLVIRGVYEGPPEPPVAVDDSYTGWQDRVLSVPAPGVLDNDAGIISNIELVSGVSHGTLELFTDGSFTYTPGAGFVGADCFIYAAVNAGGQSEAVVTLNIIPLGTPPDVVDDAYSILQANTLDVKAPGVLGNDTGVDITALLVGGPAHGTLALNPDGSFVYTPASSYYGEDSFTYRATDSAGQQSARAAVVIITVERDTGQTVVGKLVIEPALENLSVYSSFSGDRIGQNFAELRYRELGSGVWSDPYPYELRPDGSVLWSFFTVDRREINTGIDWSYTGDAPTWYYRNPFFNQWRGVLFWLRPDTAYEVQVRYTDPKGVARGADAPLSYEQVSPTEATITGIMTTLSDNPPASGPEYFVSPTGDNSNAGTSPSAPWGSLLYAISRAAPGTIITLLPGTYNEGEIALSLSGRADNWIWIRAQNLASKPIINGGAVRHGITLERCNYIRLTGLNVTNVNQGGDQRYNFAFWEDNHFIIVEDCEGSNPGAGTYGSAALCFHGGSRWPGNSYIIIQRNTFSDYRHNSNAVFGIRANALNAELPYGNILRPEDVPLTPLPLASEQDYNHGIVIKKNKIMGGGFYDGISVHLIKNFFVYENNCIGTTDDLIELDATLGNCCCAAWSNRSEATGEAALSLTPASTGPTYIFRNTMFRAIQCGVKCGCSSSGKVYMFHNTFAGSSRGIMTMGNNPNMGGLWLRNNLLMGNRYCIDWGGDPEYAATIDMDYNCLDGAADVFAKWMASAALGTQQRNFEEYRRETAYGAIGRGGLQTGWNPDYPDGYEPNGMQAEPGQIFVDMANNNYSLVDNAPVRERGLIIPFFNDEKSPWPMVGSRPDLGAEEWGLAPGPTAGFTASPDSGIAPLDVQFSDTSVNNPTTWEWDFGDGSPHESIRNPLHRFANPGQYTVTLTVTGGVPIASSSASHIITVNPPPVYYDLVITADAGGTTSPVPGVYSELSGTAVEVSASPISADWAFVDWQENGITIATVPTISVLMDADRQINARFLSTIPTQYTVHITVSGNGSTSPPGDQSVIAGGSIDITAIPNTGHRFVGWQGDISGTALTITVGPVNSDISIIATFEPIPIYSVTVAPAGNGAIILNPPGGSYYEGALVEARAIAGTDWMFENWEGDLSGMANPQSFYVMSNMSIVAVFGEIIPEPEYRVVTANVIGTGNTDPPPDAYLVEVNKAFTIAAIETDPLWRFSRWEGTVSSDTNPLSVVVTQNMNITAVFEQIVQRKVTLSVEGQGIITLNGWVVESGTYYVPDNSIVNLGAVAEKLWHFDHWYGNIAGTSPQMQVQATEDINAIAVFIEGAPVGNKWLLPTIVVGLLGTIALVGKRNKRSSDKGA